MRLNVYINGMPFYAWTSMVITKEDKMTTLYDINTRNRKPRMERFWECYVEGTNGGRHYRHLTLESAQEEAERLAKLTGEVIYLFECIGKCKIEPAPIKWEVPR